METTQVCIVDENGRKLVSKKTESSPEAIAIVLARYDPIERAVIETGRMSLAICLGLREQAVPVVCIDARQAHQSLKAMKANKTDPHVAAGLAQLAPTRFYKEVHVISVDLAEVRTVRQALPARGNRPNVQAFKTLLVLLADDMRAKSDLLTNERHIGSSILANKRNRRIESLQDNCFVFRSILQD